MGVVVRILLGALVGPLIVLCIHPLSRGYYLGPLLHPGLGREYSSSQWVLRNRSAPPNDGQLDTAAYWVLQASQEWNSGRPIDRKSLESVLVLVIKSREADPENAFWHECEAILLQRLGNPEEATRAWNRGASASRWDDLQNPRLTKVLKSLASDFGNGMSWQMAAIYGERNNALWSQIRQFGVRSLEANFYKDPQAYLWPRIHLVEHGRLLRDSARSMQGSRYGWSMVERAPRTHSGPVSVRESLEQREALIQSLRTFTGKETALFVEKVLRDNDSWSAVIDNPGNEELRNRLILNSVLTGSFGACTLVLTLLGLLLMGGGALLERNPTLQKLLSPRVAPILGVTLCAAIYLRTGLILPALWAVGCLSMFALVSKNLRSQGEYRLGNWGRVGLAFIGWPLILSVSLFAAGFWAPYQHLSDSLPGEWPHLIGSDGMAGVSLILISLAVFPAPLLCLPRRLKPSQFAGTLLREFGMGLTVTSLVLAGIVGVAMILFDKQLGDTLARISSNEPGYHLSQ